MKYNNNNNYNNNRINAILCGLTPVPQRPDLILSSMVAL